MFSYPVNVGPNAGVLSASSTWLVNVQNGYTPMINLTQGTIPLLNVTTPQAFSTFTPGATPVKEKVASVFTPAGATPSSGAQYHFYTNVSFSVTYLLTNASSWRSTTSGIVGNYSETYTLTPPAGWTFNGSTVFLPYPANVPVNTSTFNASINGVWYRSWQPSPAGVYVSIASVPVGTSAKIAVNFTAYPSVSGPAPYIVFNGYHLLFGTTYATWANYVGTSTLVWAGIYILNLSLKFAVDPTTISVLDNGHAIRPSSYVVQGSVITILPFTVFTAPAQTINFTVRFSFLTGIPSASFTDSGVAVPVGPLALTWGELLVLVMFLVAGHLGYRWYDNPRLLIDSTGTVMFPTEEGRKVAAEHLLVIAVFLVIFIAGAIVPQ